MKKKPTSPLRHNESEDLVPLTDKLYTEFSIEVLEERLETDPLLLTGLFNDITPFCTCKKESSYCTNTNCTSCYSSENCTCYGTNCNACYGDAGGYDTCTCNSVNNPECIKI